MAVLRPLPNPPQQSLEARVLALRADIDAFIDQRVEQERLLCPGVPAGSIRNMLTRSDCECRSYLDLVKDAK